MLERMSATYTDLVKREGAEAANKMVFEESRKLSLHLPAAGNLRQAVGGRHQRHRAGRRLRALPRLPPPRRADNPKTRLGLPEVKVGLFPGAGGTQRIARLLPPADALQFLLKGDQLETDRAKAMKLIDAVVPAADLVKSAKDWIKAGGKAEAPWDVKGFKLPGGPVYSGRHDDLPAGQCDLRRKTYDNYPAARAILQVCLRGPAAAMDTALRVESRYFAKMLRSPEAAAMIRTLFVSMQELNKGARRPTDVPATELEEDRRGRRRLHGRRHRARERGGRLRTSC